MRMFYISDIESVFWTVVIVAAALLLRRFRGVPAILVLIGAVAMLGQSLIISLTIHHPALDRLLDAHPDAFNVVHDLLMRYVSFCFPVGLLWLSWRIRRTAPNHAMERTADRSASTF